MSIWTKDTGGGSFMPAPPGQHAVVCCDVADLGLKDTQWGKKHKVRVYWMLSELMEDGRPFIVAQQYTNSLNERANLRRDLEAWRSVPFSEAELKGFDLEKLIGVPALISVVHNTNDGKTYANLNSIMKLPKEMNAPAVDSEYVRWQDRQGNEPESEVSQAHDDEPPPDDRDEVPF